MRKAMTIALAAGALSAGAAADRSLAQSGGPPPASPAAAGYTQLFISPAGEPYRAKAGEPYPVVLWFKQADTNHDGVITREEFRADHAGFFHALDYDDAGYLDGTKVAFYERRVLPDVYLASIGALEPRWESGFRVRPGVEPASTVDGRDGAVLIPAQVILNPEIEGSHPNEDRSYTNLGARGPAPELGSSRPQKKQRVGAAYYGLLDEPEPIRGADLNLDGRVTKEEFLEAADRRFKLLDKRHDGKLTLDELPLTPAQISLAKNGRQ